MSESRGFPAELLSFLLFGVLGVAVTAAALACFAQLMAGQGCSGSVVPILATTAVCIGSLLCALTAAFRKKARGLLTGLLQSTFLAVPLALSAIWNGTGLAEIENPSQMLLEGRPLGVSGNCVACTMEGSRPILSEIQALATKTNFPAPRRACSGYDYNRMNLLIAVLEKRAGYFFGNLDVYVNIVGGIALRDTACDLAVCLSMVSSLLDRPVSDKLIAIGEVGLGGEVRSVPNLEQRLHEAERIGFERAVIPKHSLAHLNAADYPGMKLVGAAYIADAINALKNDRL